MLRKNVEEYVTMFKYCIQNPYVSMTPPPTLTQTQMLCIILSELLFLTLHAMALIGARDRRFFFFQRLPDRGTHSRVICG